MRWLTFATYLLLAYVPVSGESGSAGRTVPCKTQEIAPKCFWSYGQLPMGGDTPHYVFWEFRTHRLFVIYSGPGAIGGRSGGENNLDRAAPELPSNVEHALWEGASGPWPNVVTGSFEICPLERVTEESEQLQAACIESARDLLVRRFQ